METKNNILFFDTETTGIIKNDKGQVISNGSLIQLAYRQYKNNEKIDRNLFFKTDTKIKIGSMAVHGIYPDLLLEKSGGKYLENDIRTELSQVFENNIIVAHNLDFDADVLKRSAIGFSDKKIDTLKVAKIMWAEGVLKNEDNINPEYINLQYLRYFFKHYEIVDENGKNECTTAHDAFGDVVVLEKVFYSLFEIIKNKLNLEDEKILEIMEEMTKKEFILIKTMRIGKYRGITFEKVADTDRGYLNWMVGADFTDDIKYTCKVWLGLEEDKKFFS